MVLRTCLYRQILKCVLHLVHLENENDIVF
jgi:hypothetical protein